MKLNRSFFACELVRSGTSVSIFISASSICCLPYRCLDTGLSDRYCIKPFRLNCLDRKASESYAFSEKNLS
jgi:hypothetical protein